MAAPQCMSDDGQPAVTIISMLEAAETFTLCADCLQAWTAAVLAGTSGVDPDRFQAVFAKLTAEAENGTPDPAIQRLLGIKTSRARPTAGGEAHTGYPDAPPDNGPTPPGSPDPGTGTGQDQAQAEIEATQAAGEPPPQAPADQDPGV